MELSSWTKLWWQKLVLDLSLFTLVFVCAPWFLVTARSHNLSPPELEPTSVAPPLFLSLLCLPFIIFHPNCILSPVHPPPLISTQHLTNTPLSHYLHPVSHLVVFIEANQFTAEEGGNDHVIATTNWHSKIKKYGYKVNKRLYRQSSNGRNGRARCSTKLNMPGS